MSADSQPITPARFAAALSDLSVESLHAKAAEIRNSIAHLRTSNDELGEFAREGDKECYEAMMENEEVIERMQHRIEILKSEVEGRGLRWIEEHEKLQENGPNGVEDGRDIRMVDAQATEETRSSGSTDGITTTAPPSNASRGGRLTDEDLRRLLAERMHDDEEQGVHL